MSMGERGQEVAAARAAGDYRVQTYFTEVDEETGEVVLQKSRTKQEFMEEQDIGNILARATNVQTQGWLEANEQWLQQQGVIDVPSLDYKETLDIIAQTEIKFMELPSKVRAVYDNDPAKFADFVRDEKGDVELRELLAGADKPIVKVDPKTEPKPKPSISPEGDKGAKVE